MAFKLIERRKKQTEDGAEMSFVDHLEELRWHIIRSLISVIIMAILIFIYLDPIMDLIIFGPLNDGFVTYKWLCSLGHRMGAGDALCLPAPDVQMQTTTFGGQFIGAITIAFVGGFVAAFPYIFWEIWRFIKPALTPKELKSSRGAIFFVSFFFALGISFGYFLLAPFTFSFLANFKIGSMNVIETKPVLNDYISNLVDITLGTGLAFQLPVISYVLTRIGLITPNFLKEYRKYAVVALLIVAAVITPSPDWMSQMIVVVPLLLLYEFSILVSRRVYRQDQEREQAEWG
ncbi:MAG TPA: twin-arginine translocase subunit TatC [Phnomibacter sp.]|nr:twin-arginine translocase subunit TatC [Phnomibacter sp.]